MLHFKHGHLHRKRAVRFRGSCKFLFAAALFAGFLATFPQSAASQTVHAPQMAGAALRARLAPLMAQPGRPMPADANVLDAMFRQGDMGRLAARLRGTHADQEVALDMNWEQAKLYDGGGFIIAYAYMYDLWRVGSSMPGRIGGELKNSAGMMFLYSLDLIMLDGLKCTDASAPAHRRDQLFTQNRPLIAYMRTLPGATRMALGTISLEIEAATATVRTDDDVLCSRGLDETTARLKANGSKPLQEVPPAPGTFGKTYALPPARNYKPQFVAANVWRPKLAKARQALPAYLTRLLTLPGNGPSAASDTGGKPLK